MRITALSLSLLLALPIIAGAAPRPAVEIAKTWTRSDAPLPRFERVAVLPAATLGGDDATAPFYFADRWAASAPGVALSTLSGSDCAKALVGVRLGRRPALEVAADEVRRDGRLREPTARFLARVLQVDALMLVRIDRWEQRAGAKAMAYVDARATLVDSTGAPWWSSTGSTRLQSKVALPMMNVPPPGGGSSMGGRGVRTTVSAPAGASGSSGSSTSSGSTGSSGSSTSSGSSGSPSTTSGAGTTVSTSTTYSEGPASTGADASRQADILRMSSATGRIPDVAPPFRAAVDSLLAAWGPTLPVRR
jgi:hypothetical protein